MSAKNDLALAYHMGYDDALAKRKPDASKTQILASDDLAAENAKLRTFVTRLVRHLFEYTQNPITRGVIRDEARELGIEVDK